MNGYMLFAKVERGKITKEHSNWKMTQVATELGKRWRKLSDAEKKKFNDKAKK